MGRAALKQMGERYSEHMQKETGLTMPFHFVSPPEARYLLSRTSKLLQSAASKLRMEEFLKFVSSGEMRDPTASFSEENSQASTSDTFLHHPYFVLWMMEGSDVDGFLLRAKEIQEGPIVLPESQAKQMVQVAAGEALEQYFQQERRLLWAFALEKAAFFLQESDPGTARIAFDCSRAFASSEMSIHRIPAAATLFQRTLDSVARQTEKEREEEKRTSVIMSPQEFERMYRKG